MRPTAFLLPLTVLLLVASPVLRAADLKYGLQFGLAATTGDLTKHDIDIDAMGGLGFHMIIPVAPNQAIRPRLDCWTGSASETVTSFAGSQSTKLTATTISLGADYLYFVQDAREHGPYLLAGLGYSSNKAELEVPAPGGWAVSINSTSNQPAYTLGGGYQLGRRWGLEARYNTTRYQAPDNVYGANVNINMNTITFAATLRFN